MSAFKQVGSGKKHTAVFVDYCSGNPPSTPFTILSYTRSIQHEPQYRCTNTHYLNYPQHSYRKTIDFVPTTIQAMCIIVYTKKENHIIFSGFIKTAISLILTTMVGLRWGSIGHERNCSP